MPKRLKRWDEKKRKFTLEDDVYKKLVSMLEAGSNRSRHEDKICLEDLTKDKIYSFVTYKNYRRSCNRFVDWIKKSHPEIRNLHSVKIDHVDEYLQTLIDEKKSAATISSYKAALAKLLQVSSQDFIATPQVLRADITRSRGPAIRDKHIAKETENFYATFTKAIGARRSEMQELRGTDLVFKDLKIEIDGKTKIVKSYPHVLIRNGKGGKRRFAPILGKNKKETQEIVKVFQKAGKKKAIGRLPNHYDNHSYRAFYAKRWYKVLARPIREIEDRSQIYFCRAERKGDAFDKEAMKHVSQYLGHSRIDVIARHYLY